MMAKVLKFRKMQKLKSTYDLVKTKFLFAGIKMTEFLEKNPPILKYLLKSVMMQCHAKIRLVFLHLKLQRNVDFEIPCKKSVFMT